MHTPGQFGPPAISAFAPLCTKRERSQIGTGNRVRTGELPIRVDKFFSNSCGEAVALAQCGNFHAQENNPLSKADAMAGPMHLHRVP